jgi:hypothetical protein
MSQLSEAEHRQLVTPHTLQPLQCIELGLCRKPGRPRKQAAAASSQPTGTAAKPAAKPAASKSKSRAKPPAAKPAVKPAPASRSAGGGREASAAQASRPRKRTATMHTNFARPTTDVSRVGGFVTVEMRTKSVSAETSVSGRVAVCRARSCQRVAHLP